MGSYRVAPAPGLAGEVTVPGDKSISHRAVMFGAIARGTTRVTGFLEGEDCLSTMRAVRELGVRVERPGPGEVIVHGVGLRGLGAPAGTLDMGNSGTAMRLFMGLLAAQPFDSVLVGDESLMRRPMERAATPLRAMGARIATTDGRPPVRITGGAPLQGIRYEMPVASAQVKSAVLLAGLNAQGRTCVMKPSGAACLPPCASNADCTDGSKCRAGRCTWSAPQLCTGEATPVACFLCCLGRGTGDFSDADFAVCDRTCFPPEPAVTNASPHISLRFPGFPGFRPLTRH